MIKTLVIDDEPLARENVILRLEKFPEFELCGQADNGHDALLLATKLNPDLIFLDIEMPGLNGVEAASRIFDELDCAIIFVTAYEEHALNAFQIDALDYLLKPINDELFAKTIERVKKHVSLREKAKSNVPVEKTYLRRLGIKDNKIVSMVDVNLIEAIEVAGDYLCITAGGKNHIHRQPLKSLLNLLDPDKFIRIHRSHAINVEHLDSIYDEDDGLTTLLKNGARFSVSRRYQKSLRSHLKKNNIS